MHYTYTFHRVASAGHYCREEAHLAQDPLVPLGDAGGRPRLELVQLRVRISDGLPPELQMLRRLPHLINGN